MMAELDVTLSTKCWEGDYRLVLDPVVWQKIWSPWGPAARRQVVLNRIIDRVDAERRADALFRAGLVDDFAWAEDVWPGLATRLGVPETWFGPAWPFAVPELAELHLARTVVLAHQAGDVALEAGDPWLPRALERLETCTVVSPMSPSRIELVRPEARGVASGWAPNHDFSDQCFVARVRDLLNPEVVRATHPALGRYPKPGGALTFEARVGSWLRQSGRQRLVDLRRSYDHPADGSEGASYVGLVGPPEHLPPPPLVSPKYPPRHSVRGTAVVLARDDVRTVAWVVASLSWLTDVLVVDLASADGTAERAVQTGAKVRRWSVDPVSRRAVLPGLVRELSGWLVVVDGDEIVPAELAHELAGFLHAGEYDGVEVSVSEHVLGRPARWRSPDLRALRVERGVFPWGMESMREPLTVVPGATVGRATTPLLALTRPGLHEWFAQVNDRTSLEARGTWLTADASLRRAAKRWTHLFFGSGGWRAGREGWRLAVLGAVETWLLTEKAWEATRGGGSAARAKYDEVAAGVVQHGQRVRGVRRSRRRAAGSR